MFEASVANFSAMRVSWNPVFLLVAVGPAVAFARSYNQMDRYAGQGFLDAFGYEVIRDPNDGRVQVLRLLYFALAALTVRRILQQLCRWCYCCSREPDLCIQWPFYTAR